MPREQLRNVRKWLAAVVAALSFLQPALAAAPPAPPSGLTAVEGNGQVMLSWQPSVGAKSYNLYFDTQPGVDKAGSRKVEKATSPYRLKGLTNKTQYFFIVSAIGEDGESRASNRTSATPLASKPVQSMKKIPAGSYLRGDNVMDLSAAAPYATPVHKVKVNAFLMAKYETTHEEWRDVHGWAIAHGYSFENAGANGSWETGTNMPVTRVSWFDVVKWLNAKSEKEGLKPVYFTDASQTTVYRTGRIPITNAAVNWNANGYRLPTDAEWEWAARGGLVGKVYPWGDELDASRANFDRQGSTSVGSYPPNGYGLHDMAGNVWEWVWDRGSDGGNYQAEAKGTENPHGPDQGMDRTRRGGGYAYGTRYLRNFEKMFRNEQYQGRYFGFRAARTQK